MRSPYFFNYLSATLQISQTFLTGVCYKRIAQSSGTILLRNRYLNAINSTHTFAVSSATPGHLNFFPAHHRSEEVHQYQKNHICMCHENNQWFMVYITPWNDDIKCIIYNNI